MLQTKVATRDTLRDCVKVSFYMKMVVLKIGTFDGKSCATSSENIFELTDSKKERNGRKSGLNCLKKVNLFVLKKEKIMYKFSFKQVSNINLYGPTQKKTKIDVKRLKLDIMQSSQNKMVSVTQPL